MNKNIDQIHTLKKLNIVLFNAIDSLLQETQNSSFLQIIPTYITTIKPKIYNYNKPKRL